MIIRLQLEGNTFARANQVGDLILRAESIELRVDSTNTTVVLIKNNIKKFKIVLNGTRRCRLEENLLTVLEKLVDLVEY